MRTVMSHSDMGRAHLAREQAREGRHLDKAVRQEVEKDTELAEAETKHEEEMEKMEADHEVEIAVEARPPTPTEFFRSRHGKRKNDEGEDEPMHRPTVPRTMAANEEDDEDTS